MNDRTFWRIALILAVLVGAVVLLFYVWTVLIPFFLGLVLAYFINPLIERFVAIGWRRDRTVLVLYGLMVGLAMILAGIILPSLYREAHATLRDLPEYTARFNVLIDAVNAELARLSPKLVGKRLTPLALPFRAEELIIALVDKVPQNLLNVAHWGMGAVIMPFVAFFALSQGRQWLDRLFDWTPVRLDPERTRGKPPRPARRN
jgi:predicted PurR-regulated permease PerM